MVFSIHNFDYQLQIDKYWSDSNQQQMSPRGRARFISKIHLKCSLISCKLERERILWSEKKWKNVVYYSLFQTILSGIQWTSSKTSSKLVFSIIENYWRLIHFTVIDIFVLFLTYFYLTAWKNYFLFVVYYVVVNNYLKLIKLKFIIYIHRKQFHMLRGIIKYKFISNYNLI